MGAAIVVEDLHEVFRVYTEHPPGLKERLYRFRRAESTLFHALDGVSLTIGHGETVGLIGHNGSGKSTLLKCIARILPPDRGSVTVDGRVATLLELGAGFAPDLTGRENMYLNGSILGISRAEIDAQFDAIVDFAGVRDFIDTPVKNYSSGMYVRLGFAIAVHVDPDVLLVDEVLAVGDTGFQEKSLARMARFKREGKTVVLVSHDLGSVADLCDRVVVLDHGRVVFDGATEQGVEAYHRLLDRGASAPAVIESRETPPDGDLAARVVAVRLSLPDADAADGGPPHVATGSKARLEIEIEAVEPLIGRGGLSVAVVLRRPDLPSAVYETRTSYRVQYLAPPPAGGRLRVTADLVLNLLSGTYLIDVVLTNAETDVVHHLLRDAAQVAVSGPVHDVGIAPLEAALTVHNPDGVWPPHSVPPAVDDGGPATHPSPLWPREGELPLRR